MADKEVYKFPFILTTIDVADASTDSPPSEQKYGEGAKYVTFDGTTHNDQDTDMVFLMDPFVAKEGVGGELDEDKQINAQISAVSVSKEWFKKSLLAYSKKDHNGKVLVYVHGFNNEPSYWRKLIHVFFQYFGQHTMVLGTNRLKTLQRMQEIFWGNT